MGVAKGWGEGGGGQGGGGGTLPQPGRKPYRVDRKPQRGIETALQALACRQLGNEADLSLVKLRLALQVHAVLPDPNAEPERDNDRQPGNGPASALLRSPGP